MLAVIDFDTYDPNCWSVVWMDFGKELPCKFISYRFEGADSLDVKVGSQLQGGMGRIHSNPIGWDDLVVWILFNVEPYSRWNIT